MADLYSKIQTDWAGAAECVAALPVAKLFTGRVPEKDATGTKINLPYAVVHSPNQDIAGRTNKSVHEIEWIQFTALAGSLAQAKVIRDLAVAIIDTIAANPSVVPHQADEKIISIVRVNRGWLVEPDGVYNAFVRYAVTISTSSSRS